MFWLRPSWIATACLLWHAATLPAGPPAPVLGWWKCETDGATYLIGQRDNRVQVLSIVDDDGEVFRVLDTRWDGRSLRFRYFVPSTGYVVIEHARPQGARKLTGDYRSLAPDGSCRTGDDGWTLIRRLR